jgi:hypothetical protein
MYSILRYTQTTVEIIKGFDDKKVALDWAKANCGHDPRWALLETPDGAPIITVQNAPKN